MKSLSLAPKQLQSFRESTAQINIWAGSVRSGKTWASLFRWIDYIINGPQGADLVILGKTTGTIERNIIEPMQKLIGGDLHFIKGGNPYLRLWGRRIWILGANDERAYQKIQGPTFAGIYGDEITTWPESLWEMALSRISIEGAQVFGTTNPDGPAHWLKKNWLDRSGELDLKSWDFRLSDNPYLPVGFVENLKKQYVGLWKKRYIDGLWCLAEGAIYDFFDEAIHVITKLPEAQYHIVGVDYGTGNPTCFILFGVNRTAKVLPKVWAIKEYYWDSKARSRQKTDKEYSDDLKAFLGPIVPRAIYIDPSAASFKLQLKRDGIGALMDADNSVIDGIRTQARMLVSGEYRVGSACRQTIDDYSNYVWNDKKARKGEDAPIKQNDHTKDAERYPLHSHFGQDIMDYSVLAA
jgi:PBSX family phage terminase large subunit